MTDYVKVAKIAAGIAGVSFLGYCIYFDRKRRSDPLFKQKLKEILIRGEAEGRERAKTEANQPKSKLKIPDLRDEAAIQKFFLDAVAKGEELLAMNDYEGCVRELTNAIAVCGQPQQLLQVFRSTLPPQVFQMLIANLTTLGSSQMKETTSKPSADDSDCLD